MNGLYIGIDIGSTTTKIAAVDANSNEVVYFDYQRHHAKQVQSVYSALEKLKGRYPHAMRIRRR